MLDWKQVKIDGIVKIERFAAEFEIWEYNKIPYGKFKVKIFETADGMFTGRTNLMVIDKKNSYNVGIGYGNTVTEALKDTISYFYSLIDEVSNFCDDCFEYVEAVEF